MIVFPIPLPPPRSHQQHRASWRPSAEDGGRVGAKGIQGDRSPCPTPPARRHSVIRPGRRGGRGALPALSPTCLFPSSAARPTQRRLGGGLSSRTGREEQAGGWASLRGYDVPPVPLDAGLATARGLDAKTASKGIRGDCALKFRPKNPTPSGPTPAPRHKKERVRERESAKNAC